VKRMNTTETAVLRPVGDWREELRYCARLCRTQGSTAVPFNMVYGYLDLQRVQARRAGRHEVATVLQNAGKQWASGRHIAASRSLEQVAAAKGVEA
jgi:hypothetical protein